jgi:peptidyl-prolyl cis-trans isomerase D
MLQSIRENSKGIIAKVIVGLIIVTFALFGIESLVGLANSEKAPAQVNGKEISLQALQRGVELQRRQLLARMGENGNPADIDENQLRRVVLEGLIGQEVLLQSAQSSGLYLSEAMIDQMIVRTPDFQVDGRFDRNQFEAVLRGAGFSPLSYRELLRKEQLIAQERNAFQLSAFATEQEVERLLKLDRQTRDIAWAELPLEPFLQAAEVSEAELEARYQAQQERFMTQPQVVLSYVELKQSDFLAPEAITPAQLQSAYQQALATFQASEERAGAHILFPEDGLEQAKEVRRRILDGELSFAEAARQYSTDPGSASQGGDLGYNGRGVFSAPFEEALFALQPGELSEPIRTEYGYHLIRLEDIRRREPPTREALEEQLRRDLAQSRAEAEYVAALERLADLSFSAGDLAVPAEELGLEIHQTEPFTRRGGESGLASHPRVVEAAFSDPLTRDGLNSDVIELDPETAVVVRVKEQIPARQLSLEEVRDQLEGELRRERAEAALQAHLDQLLAQLQSGQPLSEVAPTLRWNEVAAAEREQAEMPPAVSRKAFELPRPAQGGASFAALRLANGDRALVRVSAVHEPDLTAIDAELKQRMAAFLASRNGQLDYQLHLQALMEAAEIERN